MRITRINCVTANCEKCINRVFIKKNYWGEKLYTCPYNPKKHKAIDANDCGGFRCEGDEYSLLCKRCSGGKSVEKVLKR